MIVERLRDTPQVPGRLEKFVSADGVTAVVDYAHTDDAVRKALTVLRGITQRPADRACSVAAEIATR